MSGIVATLPLVASAPQALEPTTLAMANALTSPYGPVRPVLCSTDPDFCCAYVQRAPLRNQIVTSHIAADVITVVDGHLYPACSAESSAISLASKLAGSYRDAGRLPFDPMPDGLFAGLVYDRHHRRLTIFCDQYGLKRLYFFATTTHVYIASEVKAFLFLPNPPSAIDCTAVSSFFSHGVVGTDNTWLRDVKLLPAASTLTWTPDGKQTQASYPLKPAQLGGPLSLDDAASEAADLFQKAVEKRVSTEQRVGVRLSGGLDSRAIVAALSKSGRERFDTFTFGRRTAPDMRIASRAARAALANHHEFELTAENWFNNRTAAVWISDGQLDVQNMHGMPDVYDYQDIDVHLSGDLGGGVIGGLFLATWPDMNAIDVLTYRLRRFSGESSAYSFHFYDERYPFYDVELMRFLLALPREYLLNSKLYRRMLLKAYPGFYRRIPWQHTGVPIWLPGTAQTAAWLALAVGNKLASHLSGRHIDRAYHRNRTWFRQEPVRSLIEDILLSPAALFRDHLNVELTTHRVRQHLNGSRNHVEFLSHLLTFEIWLRSVRKRGPGV